MISRSFFLICLKVTITITSLNSSELLQKKVTVIEQESGLKDSLSTWRLALRVSHKKQSLPVTLQWEIKQAFKETYHSVPLSEERKQLPVWRNANRLSVQMELTLSQSVFLPVINWCKCPMWQQCDLPVDTRTSVDPNYYLAVHFNNCHFADTCRACVQNLWIVDSLLIVSFHDLIWFATKRIQ